MRREMTDIRTKLTELQTSVEDSSARLTVIENDVIPELKKDTLHVETELKDKILAMEIHERKMNLLFYGIDKKTDEQVVPVVRNIIKELGFSDGETQSMPIVNAHRLPRRNLPGGGGDRRGPDPIIVRFGSMFARDAVLNAYQQLHMKSMATRGQRAQTSTRLTFRVVTDLLASLKKKRFELEQRAYELRKNKNKSTRIKLIGTELHLECKEKGASSSRWKAVTEME